MFRTPVCDLLGCAFPIVLAGMGGVARSELVAAVAGAGGFGFLGMVREPVALIESEIARLRDAGVERFGVSLIPAATPPDLLRAQLQACLELKAPVVSLFWDLAEDAVRALRAAGVVVVCQVGSAEEAVAAERAGAQVLIVQGVEAGGHVRGVRPLADLLDEATARASVPILAAGGLVTGADVAWAMQRGAQGAVMGTAFIATEEAFAHAYHKDRIVAARAEDTVLTDAFHVNWPKGAAVRVLRNSVTRGDRGDPQASAPAVIGEEAGRRIFLFSTDSPLRSMTGDFEAMALYAGLGVGSVSRIAGAGARLAAIASEARAVLGGPPAFDEAVEFASPACSAHEIDDRYMGRRSE